LVFSLSLCLLISYVSVDSAWGLVLPFSPGPLVIKIWFF
jgi:hypothetical protein